MKLQFKFITGLLLMVTLWGTSFVQADLFVFPEKSLLTQRKQEAIRKIFMDVMLEASNAFIVYLQNPGFSKTIKASLNNPTVLKRIFLERLFKYSRKKDDKKMINQFICDVKHEEDFSVIINSDNDGLFNGIIRETIREYAAEYLTYVENKKEVLREIFNVLWEGITNKDLVCCVDTNFISAIKEMIGDQLSVDVIGAAFDTFHNIPGDLCNKVATVISHLLCTEFNNTIETSCCCTCLKGTYGITKKIVKKVLPVLPTLIQVALLIAKEVV